jgi:hypothetical protein
MSEPGLELNIKELNIKEELTKELTSLKQNIQKVKELMSQLEELEKPEALLKVQTTIANP